MTSHDRFTLVSLGLLASWIWARDLTWLQANPDALSLLLLFPLLGYLLQSSRFQEDLPRTSRRLPLLASVGVFLLGLGTNLTLFLALGWVGLLACFLEARLEGGRIPSRGSFLALALLAFPWIQQDLPELGATFRTTAATSVATAFQTLGLHTSQQGSELRIEGLRVEVAAPCSGVNTLQVTLVLGLLVSHLMVGYSLNVGILLPLLVIFAWAVNTLRLGVLCGLGLTLGVTLTRGPVHDLASLVVPLVLLGIALRGFQGDPR